MIIWQVNRVFGCLSYLQTIEPNHFPRTFLSKVNIWYSKVEVVWHPSAKLIWKYDKHLIKYLTKTQDAFVLLSV